MNHHGSMQMRSKNQDLDSITRNEKRGEIQSTEEKREYERIKKQSWWAKNRTRDEMRM